MEGEKITDEMRYAMWSDEGLYEKLSHNFGDTFAKRSLELELGRRDRKRRSELHDLQVASAKAQIKATEHAAQNLLIVKRSAIWTAVAAVATAFSAATSAWPIVKGWFGH